MRAQPSDVRGRRQADAVVAELVRAARRIARGAGPALGRATAVALRHAPRRAAEDVGLRDQDLGVRAAVLLAAQREAAVAVWAAVAAAAGGLRLAAVVAAADLAARAAFLA